MKKKFCLSFLAILSFTVIFAQNHQVTGYVFADSLAQPLSGASVSVKGGKVGTTTDDLGKFTISVPNGENVTLVFSFLGYTQQEVRLGNRIQINVTLKSNQNFLDEVKIVSIGYGSIKRSNLTGAVSSVSAQELSKVAVTNVTEALAGRLPGVRIQSLDGAPGSDVIVRVRNGGSITQDNSPLYVVDGLIVDNLNDVPVGDIQSIDVLKDAATTAIYGSRASNGVVMITTKQAKAGRVTVSFNNYAQMNTFPRDRKLSVLSPYEFVLMQYETAAMAGSTQLSQFTKDYGYYDDLELYKSVAPIDRQNDLFGTSVFSYYNNVSVSGGNQNSKMSLNFNSNRDQGLLEGSGQNRNAINFKLNQSISEKLKLNLSARITDNVVNGAGLSGSSQLRVSNIITARPTNGVVDEIVLDPNSLDDDELEAYLLSQLNPKELVKQDWRKRSSRSYVFSAEVNWKVLDNLTANSVFSGSKNYDKNLRSYGPLTGQAQQKGGLPFAQKFDYEGYSYRFTNTLDYKFRNTRRHDISVLLGQELGSRGGVGQNVEAGGFRPSITPKEMFANLQLGDPQYSSLSTSNTTPTNILSFFGRANYSYRDKYLLTATLRRDASSKFSKANRVGYFPAFSAGWKISSEPFLESSKVVNMLKLRVSYGETGNDNIPANSTSLLFAASDSRGPGFNNNLSSVYYQMNTPGGVLYNPDLIWETTVGKNIGLDFTLFNSVINGSLDIYRNVTRDLLVQSQIPPVSGSKYQWKNIGNTSNKGIELGLSARVLNNKDYSLSVNGNFGINKFRIDKLGGTPFLLVASNWASTDLNNGRNLDFYLAEGRGVGLIYGFVNDGMFTVDDFSGYNAQTNSYVLKSVDANGNPLVDNSAILGVGKIKPGNMKIKDISGPNGKPDGKIDEYDLTVIGNTLPKATGGLGLTAQLKGFDIAAFFNWSYGNKEYNTGKIAFNQLYQSNGGSYLNMLNTMNSSDRFTYIDVDGKYGPAGAVITDLATLGEMNQGKTIWSGNTSFGGRKPILTDWAVEDASYVRFNNLTIGYTLPLNRWKKSIVSTLRLYVTGTNLWLWTKYSGYDPDANNTRSDGYKALTPGVDYSSYPKNRSFTFGFNASF